MRYLFCGALLVLALVSASQAAPDDVLFVQASEANVREFASSQADVLTTLSRGSKVVEVGREGDWIRIRGALPNGTEGYIHGSLLRVAPTSDATAEPEPTDAQILSLTRRVSKKLGQVLREISQLEKGVSEGGGFIAWLERITELREAGGHDLPGDNEPNEGDSSASDDPASEPGTSPVRD